MAPFFTVCEIFSSVQGEAYWVGRPMVFVRFSGCPLTCPWCDEPKHRDPKARRRLSLPALLEEIRGVAAGIPSVLLTGGEPLIQSDLPELLSALKEEGYWVAMESCGVGGGIPEGLDWLTLSPKTLLDDALCRSADELKFIVGPTLEARQWKVIRSWMAVHPRVWVQPMAIGGKMDEAAAAHCFRLVMESRGQLRLSLQTQRWLGVR